MGKNSKKHYLPNSILVIFITSVCLFIQAGAVWLMYLSIKSLIENAPLIFHDTGGRSASIGDIFSKILFILICLTGFTIFLFMIIDLFILGHPTTDNEKIYCSNGHRYKNLHLFIQYKNSVYFKDIKSISIASLSTDSKGRKIPHFGPDPYLYIKNKEDEIFRFYLAHYTLRSVKKLLKDIENRCNNVGTYIYIDIPKLLLDYKSARRAVSDFGEDVLAKEKSQEKEEL